MKVRAGRTYTYDPVPLDQFAGHLRHIEPGTLVRVVSPPGCPKANTLGHCFVETLTKEFVGLVCCVSLKVSRKGRRRATTD